MWTPSVLLLDSDGKERVRIEGYLPNSDFMAALENGLGRIAFARKKYDEAFRWYDDVVNRFGQTHYAAEAMYWRAVTEYRKTQDHNVLSKVAEDLKAQYPDSVWATKALPWLH
jgi:TolA-binding protein